MTNKTTESRPGEINNSKEQGPPIYLKLEENIKQICDRLGNSPDLIVRTYEAPNEDNRAVVMYISGLIDKKLVEEYITHALSFDSLREKESSAEEVFAYAKEKAQNIGKEKIVEDQNSLLEGLLSGDTMILFDGLEKGISVSTSGGEGRSVTEATTQVNIRGPKDSFTESLGTNLSLVRKRIKNPNLWVETLTIGAVTKTDVSIMHIHGLAKEETLQQIRKKLADIHVDSILESGYIEQLIEENNYSPFPTLYNTERPDSVAGNLLEGRIAIFVDGTPFVLILPATFFMFFHTVEDYYQRYDISSIIRILRFICLLVSLFGPAIFVAALNFHQEMIPTPLLINFASQREGVPFPVVIEVLLLEVTFEIIREAGIRMPSQIGQTVSIIGGLVLGQAAVQAGIVSPAMVIVVSLTGISSFATPAFNMALSIRILRFIITFVAAYIGLYGIAIIGLMLVAHLCSLRSLGVPYMSPVAPFASGDQKDIFMRTPLHFMKTRRRLISKDSKVPGTTAQLSRDGRHES
ncbi:spore germination protein [Paenibacillus sp. FSL R7-0331]|uniref:spore germination protein n=1 Tax=Paenibacillus sp. FSL R7-0331 TaxID=1536773 RepID=UPI0004F8D824|nr:spore germination protein [Paenibacillus sp. FSL R7-0331]AIQ53733.1 spore gernimation protein KB [Paenibacillus sp. FSL R7-0331]